MSNNIRVLLVGTGNMAKEYYKVLSSMNVDVIVVGRGEKRAKEFKDTTGCNKVFWGGINKCPQEELESVSHAIVAVTVTQLKYVTIDLLNTGIKKVLVEKPAGISEDELKEIYDKKNKNKAEVYVAYNRRFYASVNKAEEILEQDGGIKSFNFEFTEWGHVIEKVSQDDITKNNWLLANSTHVIDLAFYLGGKPLNMCSYVEGELSWHKNGASYSGAGKTDKGVLFNYCANWDAPGRWGVELLTKQHRLYLRPMEKLFIQEKGSVAIEPVEFDDSIDIEYKPGLFMEVTAFLQDKKDIRLVDIDEQMHSIKLYKKIAGLD